MRMETVSQSTHYAEKCPTCGGPVRRRSYGKMYAGSFIQDGKRVDIRRVPDEHYADAIVLDALTQYFDGGLYRLFPSETYHTRGGKKLHREAWIRAFGPVPAGCHIHHRDGDLRNNSLANLECIPAPEHRSQAWHKRRARGDTLELFLPKARVAAALWHRSEAGRLWHKRHAERQKGWLKWKRRPLACKTCGKSFNALVRKSGQSQIYCSTNCRVAGSRRSKREAARRAG